MLTHCADKAVDRWSAVDCAVDCTVAETHTAQRLVAKVVDLDFVAGSLEQVVDSLEQLAGIQV